MKVLECLRGKLESMCKVLMHKALNFPPSYRVIDIRQNCLHVQNGLAYREQEADCYQSARTNFAHFNNKQEHPLLAV